MNTKRPRIVVPYNQVDIVMELISITLLIGIWLFTTMNYSELPENIAIHFNAQGMADDFGGKMTIWLLPGIATFTFLLMYFLNKFPHLHNYMVNITEENALINYRISTRLLRFINMFCMIMFAAIVYDIIGISKGSVPKLLNSWFLTGTIVIPIIAAVVAIRYQNKINEQDF